MTRWVNFRRAISRNARLVHPTKLPRRPFAIEAVRGQEPWQAGAAKAASFSPLEYRETGYGLAC
jgi:hypothetical protein